MTEQAYEIEIRNTEGEVMHCTQDWRNVLRVHLDEDGDCYIEVFAQHNSHNGVPFSVWHRRDIRWERSSCQGDSGVVSLPALEELRSQIAPLIKKVYDGHSIKWDGSNHVGRLTEEAQEASDEIERLVEACAWSDDGVAVWDAMDWVYESKDTVIRDFKLTATTTEAEMKAAAEALAIEARHEDVVLTGALDCIEELVKELKEAAEDDEAA